MPAPLKDGTHSWSVADFEMWRSLLTTFLQTRILPLLDADECRRILIRAPVKSGKREMVEYLAVRDHAQSPHRVHAFISAFHRVADEEQRKELKIHNMSVFSLVKKENTKIAIAWIQKQILEKKSVVLHIDECDFGAGDKQILSSIYKKFRSKREVTTILYSATPQEVLFSGEVATDDDNEVEMMDDFCHTGEHIEYTPPDAFCGPEKFLVENLIQDAKPFYEMTESGIVLSSQGKEIVAEIRKNIEAHNGRNICVLRLSYCDLNSKNSSRKENKAIYQFLQNWHKIPELSDFIVIADKGEKTLGTSRARTEKIDWSDTKNSYWREKTKDIPILIVIDQTSSRSTEWNCHTRICAYHDFRNTLNFGAISQAQERVNHYSTKYGSFQPIRVYGHKKSFMLSAGRITYNQYLHKEWEARKITGSDKYRIRSTSPTHTIHKDYPSELSKSDADHALQELGCSGEIKVSGRVSGTVKHKHVYRSVFYPCTKDTFPSIISKLNTEAKSKRDFENPFLRSEKKGLKDGKWMGYLRGYSVFDFETDIIPDSGWGVGPDEPRLTVCYHGRTLGIALRYDTGEVEEISTFTTSKSMYKS